MNHDLTVLAVLVLCWFLCRHTFSTVGWAVLCCVSPKGDQQHNTPVPLADTLAFTSSRAACRGATESRRCWSRLARRLDSVRLCRGAG
jgi:hypothetical protein